MPDMPEKKRSVGELLKILRNPDKQNLIPIARELVSSDKGRESIKVDFIKDLTPNTVHMLAIGLRNTGEGRQLLADNTNVTDALLKKGPSDVAMVLIGALKDTPKHKGMERLLDNKQTFVDGDKDKEISFAEALLKYGKRNEVEAALGRIIKDHKLKETNNKKTARMEYKQGMDRLESTIQCIVTNGKTTLKKSKLSKPSKRVVSVGSGAGRDR